MAKTRAELLELFGTGDKLTAASFKELINSLVTTEESSTISGSLLPYIRNTYDLGSQLQPWREIYVNDGALNFVDDQGVVTSISKADLIASKEDTNNRTLDTGIPIKRITAFEDTGSTFIDLNTTSRGVTAGTAIDFKVNDNFESLHLSQDRVSIGPQDNFPVEITGALDIKPNSNIPHKIGGLVQITGELEGSGTSGFEVSGSLIQSSSGGIVKFNDDGSSFRGGNVTIENAITAQPNVIQNDFEIGTPSVPAIANYLGTGNDDRMEINANITVTIHPGSKMIVKPLQPNVQFKPEDGEIILSDPFGISDITLGQGAQGTNPQYISSNFKVPLGNYAKWYGPIFIGRQISRLLPIPEVKRGASLRIDTNAQVRIQSF